MLAAREGDVWHLRKQIEPPALLAVDGFAQQSACQVGGMIGIGANRLPQIGRLPDQPNVYYAQVYAGHGLNATHLAGKLLAEAISGQQQGRFDLFAQVPHITFPGGKHLRSPLLALGMLWHRFKELV